VNQRGQKGPLVSIITVTLNRGKFLEKAIRSVMEQDYDNLEHIIVDGGSFDNTVEILKKYEGKYNLRWISEKDKNQTEAWNKGLKMARGEIIGYCHSDDYYLPGAIKKIVEAFLENPDVDLVFGKTQEFNFQTKRYETIFQTTQEAISSITVEDLLYGKKTFFQQSLFYRRRIIDKVGPLNPDIEFVMDVDWWVRMLQKGAKALYLDTLLAIVGHHPERGCVKEAARATKAGIDLIRAYGYPVPFRMKISYLRWKYPQIPNFFKKYLPSLFSTISRILKKA